MTTQIWSKYGDENGAIWTLKLWRLHVKFSKFGKLLGVDFSFWAG